MSGDDVLGALEKRLGRQYARQRLGIEKDHEAQVFGQGLNFFHFENLSASRVLISSILRASCIYALGRRNAAGVELRHHNVSSALVPPNFDGFRILHLSDLHADISKQAMA